MPSSLEAGGTSAAPATPASPASAGSAGRAAPLGGGGSALETEAALLEKIEELSFLRELSEVLSSASDFGSACRALTELVWAQLGARRVSYLSLDSGQGRLHLEASFPLAPDELNELEFRVEQAPLAEALNAVGPLAFADADAAPWTQARRLRADTPLPADRPILITTPLRSRGSPLGLVVVETIASNALPEALRLLAVTETTAALALDKARDPGREEFLAILRHDLSNPVHTALGYLDMLLDEIEERQLNEMRPAAQGAASALRAVADLIANALRLPSINRGADGFERRPLELADLCETVAASLRPAAGEKKQTLVCDFRPVRLVGDARQLRRVLANLLGNALKYTPDGGTIELRCGPGQSGPDAVRASAGAWFEIEDDGLGVPPEALPRLFQKYARFHAETGIPGTGLGLYSSRAIVEAHGGSIEALPRRDGRCGSLFCIHLPG